jgi:hypothetical protein
LRLYRHATRVATPAELLSFILLVCVLSEAHVWGVGTWGIALCCFGALLILHLVNRRFYGLDFGLLGESIQQFFAPHREYLLYRWNFNLILLKSKSLFRINLNAVMIDFEVRILYWAAVASYENPSRFPLWAQPIVLTGSVMMLVSVGVLLYSLPSLSALFILTLFLTTVILLRSHMALHAYFNYRDIGK